MKKHFGIIWFLPVFIASVFLSGFIPNAIGVGLFIINFITFLLTKKCYNKREAFFNVNFILMIFSSLHFFGYCIIALDPTEYDSISEEKTAEAVSWVLYLPLAFIFSLTAGLLFDKWKNHKSL